jgi:Regulator of ribonuclease activity B
MSWPETADGDVFRRLEASGFDFSVAHVVDYNIDFDSWPPTEEAISLLTSAFGQVSVHTDQGETSGYVRFQEAGLLKYERVVTVQELATQVMAPFGGVCESWGVLH